MVDRSANVSALSDEKRLIKHLLDKYEQIGVIGRPVSRTSQTVEVSYGMSLIQILDVDEKNQVLTINVWSRYVRLLLYHITLTQAGAGYATLAVCLFVCVCVCVCLTG